jgi:O-antigen/teichoic acid export membrane protein
MFSRAITRILVGLRLSEFTQKYTSSIFVQQVSLTFATRIVIMVIGFGASIVTARYLGPEGQGVYAVLMAIIAMGMQFGNFGLHASNTYFVAKDRGLLAKIIGNTFWLSLVGGTVISLIILGILYFRHSLIAGIPFSLVAIAAVAIPFGLLFLLGQNTLLGVQRIRALNGFEAAKSFVFFLSVIVLLIPLALGVHSIIVATAVLTAFFALIVFGYLRSLEGNTPTFDMGLLRRMAGYGFKAYLAALFAFLVIRFSMLMVNYYLGASDTGIYSVTVSIGDILYMLPVSIGFILFPKVSAMKEGGWEFTKKVAWITAGAVGIICIVAALVARPFVTFFYGQEFAGAADPLLWLLPGIFVLGINTIFMNFFAGRGMPIVAVVCPFIALVMNVLLNLYFIPHYGIKGAAMTSSISYLIMLAISLIYLRTSVNVRSK